MADQKRATKTGRPGDGRTGSVTRVIAGCFALAAFATAIVVGSATDNPASLVVTRALIAMLVCYPLCLLIGLVCHHVVMEHVTAHEAAHPIPPASEGSTAAEAEEIHSPEAVVEGVPEEEEVIEV